MSEPVYWWLQGILFSTCVESIFWLIYLDHLKKRGKNES